MKKKKKIINIPENTIKVIEIKSLSYALIFCRVCNIFRPIRAHHCYICDVCIEELGINIVIKLKI